MLVVCHLRQKRQDLETLNYDFCQVRTKTQTHEYTCAHGRVQVLLLFDHRRTLVVTACVTLKTSAAAVADDVLYGFIWVEMFWRCYFG